MIAIRGGVRYSFLLILRRSVIFFRSRLACLSHVGLNRRSEGNFYCGTNECGVVERAGVSPAEGRLLQWERGLWSGKKFASRDCGERSGPESFGEIVEQVNGKMSKPLFCRRLENSRDHSPVRCKKARGKCGRGRIRQVLLALTGQVLCPRAGARQREGALGIRRLSQFVPPHAGTNRPVPRGRQGPRSATASGINPAFHLHSWGVVA